MKRFDVVRVFYMDLDFFYPEFPTDDVFRSYVKKFCKGVGSFAMAYDETSIIPIIGEIPFSAHWHNDFVVIGNVLDGYTIDKSKFQDIYNDVQKFIATEIEKEKYLTFDEDKFKNNVVEYIKSQSI